MRREIAEFGGTMKQNNLDQMYEIFKRDDFDINTAGLNGITPLLLAVYENKPDLVKIFLKMGANPNQENTTSHATPLMSAIFPEDGAKKPTDEERIQIVTSLLNDKRTKDFVSGYGPMYLAAQTGNREIVKLLLENEDNLGSRFYRRTKCQMPSQAAFEAGHKELAVELSHNRLLQQASLEMSLQFILKDKFNEPACDIKSMSDEIREGKEKCEDRVLYVEFYANGIIEYKTSSMKQPDIITVNDWGSSCFPKCIPTDEEELKLFKNKIFEITSARSHTTYSPKWMNFFNEGKGSLPDDMIAFYDKKPLVLSKNSKNIMEAIKKNNIDDLVELFRKGATYDDVSGPIGHTGFFTACKQGNLEIVKLLVWQGASITTRESYNQNWITPLELVTLKANETGLQVYNDIADYIKEKKQEQITLFKTYMDSVNEFSVRLGH